MKKIPEAWKKQHRQLKNEWQREKSALDFYEWLVERYDKIMKLRREK